MTFPPLIRRKHWLAQEEIAKIIEIAHSSGDLCIQDSDSPTETQTVYMQNRGLFRQSAPELLEKIYQLAAEADTEAGWGVLDGVGEIGEKVCAVCNTHC